MSDPRKVIVVTDGWDEGVYTTAHATWDSAIRQARDQINEMAEHVENDEQHQDALARLAEFEKRVAGENDVVLYRMHYFPDYGSFEFVVCELQE